MTKLSVNINKVATIRNARGGNTPNIVQFAIDCESFGADGITVHPRPDERHITLKDVYDLSKVVKTEFNIEGYPDSRYLKIIEEIKPAQATLVPDPPHVLTSNAGWKTKENLSMLTELADYFRSIGVRSSIFVDTIPENIEYAAKSGVDRIELYTGPYAEEFSADPDKAIREYARSPIGIISYVLVVKTTYDGKLFTHWSTRPCSFDFLESHCSIALLIQFQPAV